MNNDLISREALKREIAKATYNFEQIPIHVDKVQEIIDNAPTVEAYPFEQVRELVKLNQQFAQEIENLGRPQGEWIIDGHHRRCNYCNEYICTEDREGNSIPDNYCPNCGARLRNGG